ncbi:hypothetical protein [Bdellovibrio sp. HCB337]|uniref:hypothetical protein n=1 Tax=Bdellovibrio sp. HCB337 TaxID=3394358 RepID=UPI0039A6A849
MNFSDLENEFKVAESKIPSIESTLPFYQYVYLKSSALTDATLAIPESLIIDGPISKTSNKKSVRLEFKHPVYISEMTLTTKGTFTTRRIHITYFGGIPGLRNSEFKKVLSPSENHKIEIRSIIAAIEITTSKYISECIESIDILGDLNFNPSKFQDDLSTYIQEFTKVDKEIRELTATAIKLSTKGKDAENQLESQQLQQKDLAESIEDLEGTKTFLNTEIKDLTEAQHSLHTNIDRLKSDEQALSNNLKSLQTDINTKRDQQFKAQVELDQVLERKNFYNSTLEGFKAETKKNFWINFSIIVLLSIMATLLSWGAINYYEHALDQIAQTTESRQIYAIAALRLGAGAIFLTAFYWLFGILKVAVRNNVRLLTETRNIEAKLILAKNTAETVLNGKAPGEKRNYATFLSFIILKNHFMNMSYESLAQDLEIDGEQLETVTPILPARYDMKNIIGGIRNILKSTQTNGKTDEAN